MGVGGIVAYRLRGLIGGIGYALWRPWVPENIGLFFCF